MGTNYYWTEKEPCRYCGRLFETRHIGKSSCGWSFALHVYPNENIRTLGDWKKLLKKGQIVDEYDNPISYDVMLLMIVERRGVDKKLTEHWLQDNHAVRGKNNLASPRIDGIHCIGHGKGTYDYIIGEFS